MVQTQRDTIRCEIRYFIESYNESRLHSALEGAATRVGPYLRQPRPYVHPGQGFGVFGYLRNLYFIKRERRGRARRRMKKLPTPMRSQSVVSANYLLDGCVTSCSRRSKCR